MSLKDGAETAVRDIRRKTRKQYSAEGKIRIVLSGLRGEDSIAELCRREGIAESLYYSWSKECQWRSKKGPPRRCKKGPLGGCGLVPVVHGRAPRATRRALNRLTRRRAREGPVGPTGSSVGWVSVQLAVGV